MPAFLTTSNVDPVWVDRRRPPTSGAPFRSAGLVDDIDAVVEYPQGPHEAPDAIRQSDFTLEGKPANHAVSTVPVFTSLNIAGIESIQADDFLVTQFPRGRWTATPPFAGGMAPWSERVNIDVPPALAYGSLFQLSQPGRY